MRRALLVALAAAAVACGKKGDPLPPLSHAPARTTALRVEQRGDTAVLTLPFPTQRADGALLTDLAAIEIYRIVNPSPSLTAAPTAVASGIGGSSGADHAPIAGERRRARTDRTREQVFLDSADRIAVVESRLFDAATRGGEIVYRDSLEPLFSPGPPPEKLAYAVVAVRRDGERSDLSNIATIAPAVPPGAPRDLLALPEAHRVCLFWTAPSTDVAGQPAEPEGYRVYRRRLEDSDYAAPLDAEPVKETELSDSTASYGDTYVYTVTAVAKGHTATEGPPAIQIGLEYRDVYPPPPVASLDALPEEHLVRVLWQGVAADDLAGYDVYRAEGGGEPVRLNATPISATEYVDATVSPGRVYRYDVRSIDKNGNESAPSPAAEARPFSEALPPEPPPPPAGSGLKPRRALGRPRASR